MQTGFRHIIFVVVVLACMCACSEDSAYAPATSGGVGTSFVVSAIAPATRVSYDGYVSSTFEIDDELGAFVVDKTGGTVTVNGKELPEYAYADGYTLNARYRVAEGSFTVADGTGYTHTLVAEVPTDTFPANKRYVFYYPYKAGADITDFSHTVLADQSRETAFESSDLLRARVNATDDESTVPGSIIGTDEATGRQLIGVSMEHVMTSIVLKVEQDLVPEAEAEASTAAGLVGVYCTVSGIDLTRALTPDEQGDNAYGIIPGENVDQGDIIMRRIGMERDGDGAVTYTVYRAVMPAQQVGANAEFISFDFKEGGEKVYRLNVDGDNAVDFKPGEYYLFTLTKDGGLRFRGLIEDLEDGGDYFYEY